MRAQFLAGPNLLTGNTDGHWRAVRKGVAPAFSATHMRCAAIHTFCGLGLRNWQAGTHHVRLGMCP